MLIYSDGERANMTSSSFDPNIQWDTLGFSATPLQGRSGILVVAQFKTQKQDQKGPDEYRVNFELNRHHGLVCHDTELLLTAAGEDGPRWRYSGRRDLVVAVKDRFLTTQLYAHVAGQLGWVPDSSVWLDHAPLDP
ncbi:hypothetical protein AAII07_48250 [Microvirga sp. 0TCS3.31]